jgi:predicted RNA-binding Zn-ribbon protein involved in translation (DUF1610 family)
MTSLATRGDLLGRLRENEKINSRRLKASGFLGETRTYRCPECGLFETLIFWNSSGGDDRLLKFRCPNGCSTEIRFDPRLGEGAKTTFLSPMILATWLLVSMFGLGMYAWSASTPEGRAFVAHAWESSQTRFYELGLALPWR